MPIIPLKAKLRAYARAPFHADYIREAPLDGDLYVRVNGEWKSFDTTVIQEMIEKYDAEVDDLEEKLYVIDLGFNAEKNQLVFTNGHGDNTYVTIPGTNVDGETIGLRTGTNQLYVMDTPDGTTIKVVDVEREPFDIFDGIGPKISGKLRVDGVYAEFSDTVLTGQSIHDRLHSAEKNITDLEAYIQGKGGFLDPVNFGNNLNTKEMLETNPETGRLVRDHVLDQVAYDLLNSGNVTDIPDQTKIKNMFDGHIWVYVAEKNTWLDDGADTIVNANNHGVLGVVTGVAYDPNDESTKFKISVEEDSNNIATGVMSVNGLKEEFQQVVYIAECSDAPDPSTYVRRTTDGTVRTSDSVDGLDAINRQEFERWQEDTILSDGLIRAIVYENFLPELRIESN